MTFDDSHQTPDGSDAVSPGTPLVSVVLPTRNGSRYLAESVESVLSQTYGNLELILVDDASSDSTPEMIAAYVARDGRVRTIRHDENVRVPRALNSGFEIARGEYLTWTSDDNLYRPTAIEEMVAALEADPNVDFVYADYSEIDENGDLLRSWRVRSPAVLVYANTVSACFLYRRKVFETLGGYDPDFRLVEDYEYWLRVANRFRMKPINHDLYLYRYHPRSLTSRESDAHPLPLERVLLRYVPRMKWAGTTNRARAYRLLAELALRRRAYGRAVWRALRAARLAPRSTARWVVELGRKRRDTGSPGSEA